MKSDIGFTGELKTFIEHLKNMEVKILKGKRHAIDRKGNRYRINGLLIKKDMGREVLYTLGDNENLCGIYSKGDFYKAVVCEGTYSNASLLGKNLINLL